LLVFYYLSVSEIWPDKKGGLCWEGIVVRGGLWWGLIRWVVSLEGNNLLVFYYLSVSEIWPDKRGGLCWERIVVRGIIKGGLL
jgi:hypothetical protein